MAEALSSAESDPPWPQDAVEVGLIVDAWGVKGWVKIQPFASDPQALFSSNRWFIKAPEGSTPKPLVPRTANWPSLLKVAEAKEHAGLVVARLQGVVDRQTAESLRGFRLFVGRSSFPTAGPEEYYWVDLIGLSVLNRQGDDLGTVVGLIETGAQSVLRIKSVALQAAGDATERLIPFVSAYVDEVNLSQRRITVDWSLDY